MAKRPRCDAITTRGHRCTRRGPWLSMTGVRRCCLHLRMFLWPRKTRKRELQQAKTRITAAMVKEVRERTGVWLLGAKALLEVITEAIAEALRKERGR